MTIEAKGHVHSIEAVGGGITEVAVTLHLESSRVDHPHRMTIRAKPAEIDSYKVGMAIILQVRPA